MQIRWLRISGLILVFGSLLVLSQWGTVWLMQFAETNIGVYLAAHRLHIIIVGIGLYTVLMAMPFLPGMEISLALLAVFGPAVALPIYIATIGALSITFLIGRFVPLSAIGHLFDLIGFVRARALVLTLSTLDANQRLQLLTDKAPKRIVPSLLRYRYLMLMTVLNIPGNAIIGGGGGIALIAGLSGVFAFPKFLLAIALAVLPVPLFIMLSGY